jgi:hypothetical protein
MVIRRFEMMRARFSLGGSRSVNCLSRRSSCVAKTGGKANVAVAPCIDGLGEASAALIVITIKDGLQGWERSHRDEGEGEKPPRRG